MVRKLISMLILLSFLSTCAYAEKAQRYMPYPVVFVSGIKTKADKNISKEGSPSKIWSNSLIFKKFEKYFSDGDDCIPKYDDEGLMDAGEVSHLEFFFYDAQQNTLEYNAGKLKEAIEEIIAQNGRYYKAEYLYTEPCPSPKVVIVAHSLGGLITRYMLANYDGMKDKVAAVFFLGVQQKGSPLACIGYFLPKEIPYLISDIEKMEALADVSTGFRKRALLNLAEREKSKIVGNLKFMKWAEGDENLGLYTSTRNESDTERLRAVLGNNPYWLSLLNDLPDVREKGVIKAALIPDNAANSYQHTFKAYAFNGPMTSGVFQKITRNIPTSSPLSYDIRESDLYGLSTNIGVKNVHAIVGTEYNIIQEGLYGVANSLIGWDNFYSRDYSCIRNGFFDNGDGISNLASQSGIGTVNNIHEIEATHSGDFHFPGSSGPLLGETEHPQTFNIILNAIDDVPIIKNISICPVDWNNNDANLSVYVVAKVQDYLLANIRIAYLTDDKIPLIADLTNFYIQGELYPYVKFDRDFVKQRNTDSDIKNKDGTNRTLYPGELYVRLDTQGDEKHTVKLKMKNPANKESEEKTVEFQRPVISDMSPTGTIEAKRPTIKAKIFSGLSVPIDSSSVTMTLDGGSVPCTVSGSDVTYTPSSDLSETTHTVRLNGRDINGLPAQEKTWTFTIHTPEPPTGYFVVSVPSKIAIDQDFTMKVTAYTADGQIMDGQEGRPVYAEGANITISGDPAPQGSLAFNHINPGSWVNGVWEITNQCYSNSDEEKYKLTITVTDSGGDHANMTGSTDTIVGPLELTWYVQGDFQLSDDGTFWTYHDGAPTNLGEMCTLITFDADNGAMYYPDTPTEAFGGGAYAYRIDVPADADINYVKVKLRVTRLAFSYSYFTHIVWFSASPVFTGSPDGFPINFPSSEGEAIFNVDMHSTSPSQTQSLIGSTIFSCKLAPMEEVPPYTYGANTIKETRTDIPCTAIPEVAYEFSIPAEKGKTIWLTFYISNIQEVVGIYRSEANESCGLDDPTWGNSCNIVMGAKFDVIGVLGYK